MAVQVNVPTVHLVIEEINIGGSLVGNFTELVELMELNADGKVKMHYTEYNLASINTALDDFKNRRFTGRGASFPEASGERGAARVPAPSPTPWAFSGCRDAGRSAIPKPASLASKIEKTGRTTWILLRAWPSSLASWAALRHGRRLRSAVRIC